MANGNGLNTKVISIVITLLVIVGTFVGGYHVLQYRVASAEADIAEVDSKFDGCVKEIQSDMSDVKIDVAKLQIDVETIKGDNKYVRNRLDFIVSELAKQNRNN